MQSVGLTSHKVQFRFQVEGNQHKPAIWLSGYTFVSGAGGLRFKSRAGQIGQSVANGSPPLRNFSGRSCAAHRRNETKMDPTNMLHASA